MHVESLRKIGLTQSEAKVYLCLLRLNHATATEISRESGVERTLCYSILQKLIDKGLVSYIYQKKIRIFNATNPRKILEDINERREEIEKIMPQLISLAMNKKNSAKQAVPHSKELLTKIKLKFKTSSL